MATISSGGAMAHSPLMNEPAADPADEAPIGAYKRAVAAAGARIRASRPDIALVIGQDHFRSHFYDLMPAFTIGTGTVSGWGDWGTREGSLTDCAALGRYLHRGLIERGFDVACSYDLLVDHGVTQVLDLLELPQTLPLLPLLINTSASPLPTPARCYALGEAVGNLIRDHGRDLRVAVIGSGGVSHRPPAGNVESEEPADAEQGRNLIHGRDAVRRNEAARRERLIAAVAAGRFSDSINPAWDREILDIFCAGTAGAFARSATEASIEAAGGSGGQEIRTWLAAAGAYQDRPAVEIFYHPIPSLITGMGAIAFD